MNAVGMTPLNTVNQ